MRNAFVRALERRAAIDDRVVLLSGDIGNRMFDRFKAAYPDRFINCGVAEQNMMSVAAGMAADGLRPVVYTIAPFVTTRCLEQIKVDVCYHRAPVLIVGVGGGLSYASLGATHHATDDIAQLRALPESVVLCPGDAHEVEALFEAAANRLDCSPGAVYLRLGKKNEPLVHASPPRLRVGESKVVRPGRDVSILACGTLLPAAIAAAESIEDVDVEVVSFPTVKPLDEECLRTRFAERRLVVTLEEHSLIGGFGGAVAEWWVDGLSGLPNSEVPAAPRARLLRLGLPDAFVLSSDSLDGVRRSLGLDPVSIAARVRRAVVELETDSPSELTKASP